MFKKRKGFFFEKVPKKSLGLVERRFDNPAGNLYPKPGDVLCQSLKKTRKQFFNPKRCFIKMLLWTNRKNV